MGVIYFLVCTCVWKHESNLPTMIRTTVGKKTQGYVEKCDLLSETTLLPYFYDSVVCFLLPKCVFLPMVFFITTVCFFDFCKQCW